MKKLFILLAAVVMTANAMAYDAPQFSQNPNAIYRLFPTQNIHIFIKLDTRNGMMELIQWGTNMGEQQKATLSDVPRVSKENEKPGRFTLYATTNIYNFILLDQITGKTWQVQWSFEPENRMTLLIE